MKKIEIWQSKKIVLLLGVILFLRPNLLIAKDYFPISVGNRWVFHKRGGKDVRLIEVLSVQQELAASRTDKKPKQIRKFARNGVVIHNSVNFRSYFLSQATEGWYQFAITQFKSRKDGKVRSSIYTYDKDQMFIPKQMRLEKKWTTLGNNSRRKVEDILTTNFKTISMENIKIKAGHFLRVMCVSEEAKRQRKDRMKSWLSYMWLAPNVGPIQLKTVNEEIFELVEYNLTLDLQLTNQQLSLQWGHIKFHKTGH